MKIRTLLFIGLSDFLFIQTPNAQTDNLSELEEKEMTLYNSENTLHADTNLYKDETSKFQTYQIVVPSLMIAYGIIGMHNNFLKNLNTDTKHEISEHRLYKVTLDDYIQFAPTVATYGIKLFGVKSEHNYWQITAVSAVSYAVSTALVSSVKYTTRTKRPDGSSDNSFPSGHTACAFVGAEILRREYWKTSPYIGFSGYIVAIGIGCFRVFNERHWVTDVVAGGGFGILSANIGYWSLPLFNKILPKKNKNIAMTPFYINNGGGVAMTLNLN